MGKKKQELEWKLEDISNKFKEFKMCDTEHQGAVERKNEWLEEHMHYPTYDTLVEIKNYPFQFEIDQWGLRRELALKELGKLVAEGEYMVTYSY